MQVSQPPAANHCYYLTQFSMRATTTAASNIRLAGHNPVHQAFLSSPRGLPETSKMTDLCLSGVFFSSSKIHQKSFSAPDHAEGAYDAPPDPLVGWGGGHPLPSPFPSSLDSFGISIWPPTSLKFIHLALPSKRLDIPEIEQAFLRCAHFLPRLIYVNALPC